jgi:hypothetical protein
MKALMLLNIGCLLSAAGFASQAIAKEKGSAPLPPGWEKAAMRKSDRMLKKVAIEGSEVVEIRAETSRLVVSPEGKSGVVTKGWALPPGYRAVEAPIPPAKKAGTSKGIPRTGPPGE